MNAHALEISASDIRALEVTVRVDPAAAYRLVWPGLLRRLDRLNPGYGA